MGHFNVDYANSFPELQVLNLSTSNVLSQVTKDPYNFGTVGLSFSLTHSHDSRALSPHIAVKRHRRVYTAWLTRIQQGAWYYKLQPTAECTNARLAALNATTTAWEWFSQSYLFNCVGVDISAQTERTVYWNNAMAALGFCNDTVMGL